MVKAMVMAAGVGSRLEPLTLNVPKPLIPIANKPVMDILLENLRDIGIKDVVANTYYLSEKIIARYKNNNIGIDFDYITEENLSGTAGGLKKCQYFFEEDDDFIVLSADGLTNADLLKGIKVHKSSGAIATIGVKQIPHEEVSHFGVVVTEPNGYISEFQEKPSIEEAKSNLVNTGIYIFSYKIFDYIPENTFFDFAKNVFPKLLEEHEINTFEINEYWSDIGTLDQYKQSSQDVFSNVVRFNHANPEKTANGSYISGKTEIPSDTEFVGNSTIGHSCEIGKNVVIENSIIWNNVKIADNVKISNSIVASNNYVKTDLSNEIIGEANCVLN